MEHSHPSFSQTQDETQPFFKKQVFKSPLIGKQPTQSHVPTSPRRAPSAPSAPQSTSSSKKRNLEESVSDNIQLDRENRVNTLETEEDEESKSKRQRRDGSTSSPVYSKPFASSSPPFQSSSPQPPLDFKDIVPEAEVVPLTPLQGALVKYNQKLRNNPTWATEMEIDYEKECEREVGRLTTLRGGRTQVLAVQLNKPFLVGRHFRCDYVIPDPRVSAYHFKLFAHLTDSGDIFVVLEDTSRNGLLWNGKSCAKHSVILSEGDKIEIPGCQSFIYTHLASEDDRTEEKFVEKVMTIDKYILLNRILGTGSYAKVFLAYDTASSRQVACKRQAISHEDKTSQKNLRREIELLKQMKHPNINRLFDQLEDAEHIYLFVNLVAGGDLFNYVAKHRRLADAESKFITYQIVKAVQFLHKQGIAHRDLKPENILLLTSGSDRFPHIQLGDFGLAFQAVLPSSSATAATAPKRKPGRPKKADVEEKKEAVPTIRASSTCGTVSYLPPEAFMIRVTGESYDPLKLDIWGIGCILFVMLCGAHPFDHHSVDTPDDLNHLIRARVILDGILPKSFFEKKLRSSDLQDLNSMIDYSKLKEEQASKGWIDPSPTDEDCRFLDKFELVKAVLQVNWQAGSVLDPDPKGNGGGKKSKAKVVESSPSGMGGHRAKEGIKKEAYDLMAAIFQFSPSARPSARGILKSQWIFQSGKELEQLYKAKVPNC